MGVEGTESRRPGTLEAEYADRYAELYRKHWWWRAREEVVVREVARLTRGSPEATILDVGCGPGLLFPRLEPFGEVEGVEPDARMGTAARGRSIHLVPFEEFHTGKRYSLILMLDVLEHLRDPAGALRRARGLLGPEGRVLVTVPAFNLLWTTHDELNHHFTRYRTSTLLQVAEEAGLLAERSRYLFHWVFFAKLLVRVREALLPVEPSPPSVPPAPANTLLYRLSRLEDRVAGPLRVPFGSSLLMTLRKANAEP